MTLKFMINIPDLQYIIRNRNGIAFLLMIVLLAAFFSIAMGIINILLGQIFIVGQAGESFEAFYASDIGMERTMYRDRVQNICSSGCACTGSGCVESSTLSPEDSCYTSTLVTGPSASCQLSKCITISAKSKCGSGVSRYVQREFTNRY